MFKVNDLVKSKVTGFNLIVTYPGDDTYVHVKTLNGMHGEILAERIILVGRNYKRKAHVKTK